jgi:hypothetical protein
MRAIALWFPNLHRCKTLISNDLYASLSSGGCPYRGIDRSRARGVTRKIGHIIEASVT